MTKAEIVYKKTDDLIPYANNPRLNDDAVDAVAASIKEFGFKQPIVVDSENVIVVGHTRYKASKKLGLEQVPVIVASDLTPAQAKAYRIADNKTSDMSIWDNKKLLLELEDIGDELFTGFEEGEVFLEELVEADNDVIKDNEEGVIYHVKFRSPDQSKIEEIIQAWEQLV